MGRRGSGQDTHNERDNILSSYRGLGRADLLEWPSSTYLRWARCRSPSSYCGDAGAAGAVVDEIVELNLRLKKLVNLPVDARGYMKREYSLYKLENAVASIPQPSRQHHQTRCLVPEQQKPCDLSPRASSRCHSHQCPRSRRKSGRSQGIPAPRLRICGNRATNDRSAGVVDDSCGRVWCWSAYAGSWQGSAGKDATAAGWARERRAMDLGSADLCANVDVLASWLCSLSLLRGAW